MVQPQVQPYNHVRPETMVSRATEADLHEFARRIDSLVYLSYDNKEARTDDRIFERANLESLWKRIKVWEKVVRRKEGH